MNSDSADRANSAAHDATGEETPLTASKGWIAATVVAVGIGMCAPTIGVGSVVYLVGITQTVG